MTTIDNKYKAPLRHLNRNHDGPPPSDTGPPYKAGSPDFAGRPQKSQARPRPQSESSDWRELGMLGIKVAVIIGIALFVFNFVYGLHYNLDTGMDPTVRDGDLVLYYRGEDDFRARDLVLVTFQGQTQIRRVIAIAGDTVDINEKGLVINGALQKERNITHRTERYVEGIDFPITLGKEEVFVLGDAREDVTDSRIYGAVNVNDTQGVVIAILRHRNL